MEGLPLACGESASMSCHMFSGSSFTSQMIAAQFCTRNTFFNILIVSIIERTSVIFPPCADTHGQRWGAPVAFIWMYKWRGQLDENLTGRKLAWRKRYRTQVGCGPITSNPPWRNTQKNSTEQAGSMAETLWTFSKQASKELLKIVTSSAWWSSCCSCAGHGMGALEHQEEHEMNGVAVDHWKTRGEICWATQMRNFNDTTGKANDIFKKISMMFNAI